MNNKNKRQTWNIFIFHIDNLNICDANMAKTDLSPLHDYFLQIDLWQLRDDHMVEDRQSEHLVWFQAALAEASETVTSKQM